MKTKRKLNSKSGFTLAETLLTVLILLLVSTIVATGIPVAKNAYEKVVVAANAQVLLSTTATALRDELGTAWDVKIDDNTTATNGSYVTYFSSDTGAKSKIYLGDGNKIYLQEYLGNTYLNETENSVGIGRPLISDKAANENLVITYKGVSLVGTSVKFEELTVKKDGEEFAGLKYDLTIPVISVASTSST